jgi:hypothetical protein
MRYRRKRALPQEEDPSSAAPATTRGEPEIVDLTLDSDDENIQSNKDSDTVPNNKKIKSEGTFPRVTPAFATTPATSLFLGAADVADDDDDGEVEIVDPTTLFPTFTPASNENNNNLLDQDEDLRVVGTKNHVELPHNRQNCTNFPHNALVPATSNQQYCAKCYCFVCDTNASECQEWDEHCHATDAGPYATKWRNLREQVKNAGSTDATPAFFRAMGLPVDFSATVVVTPRHASMYDPFLGNTGPGPLAPNTTPAPSALRWTACRYCKWYTMLQGQRYQAGGRYINPVPFLQWCLACGRIASAKPQNVLKEDERFVPNENGLDVCLGTKDIPFRLHAHDPRQMKEFRTRWEESSQRNNDNWAPYSKQQMQHDLFHHRVTQHPNVGELVNLMSPFAENDIPKDGQVKKVGATRWGTMSAVECDALLLDDPKHVLLLQKLAAMAASRTIKYQLSASWDNVACRGVSVE